jgi:NAD(P)H-dependent flavin oxidoreductase YrpB (nitropropane dioxygenase family)
LQAYVHFIVFGTSISNSFSLKKKEGLLPLLPRVVDLVSDSTILVIAAGGIVDGRGYAAALALGADGVCLGTRYSLKS